MFIRLCLLVLLSTGSAWALDGHGVTSKADVTVTNTATLISAQNAYRSALSCTNTSATVNVRWGDATVTASQGQQLKAGSPIEITNTAPVYMISEGANVTVSCTEETR